MGSGRRGKAPCGHEGEHIIGQYVRCDTCDVAVSRTTTEPIGVRCKFCASPNVKPFVAWNLYLAGRWYRCDDCTQAFAVDAEDDDGA